MVEELIRTKLEFYKQASDNDQKEIAWQVNRLVNVLTMMNWNLGGINKTLSELNAKIEK